MVVLLRVAIWSDMEGGYMRYYGLIRWYASRSQWVALKAKERRVHKAINVARVAAADTSERGVRNIQKQSVELGCRRHRMRQMRWRISEGEWERLEDLLYIAKESSLRKAATASLGLPADMSGILLGAIERVWDRVRVTE